jgi:hypothetical protein
MAVREVRTHPQLLDGSRIKVTRNEKLASNKKRVKSPKSWNGRGYNPTEAQVRGRSPGMKLKKVIASLTFLALTAAPF